MYKVILNTSIPYNYSFYCPKANVMLTQVSKVAFVEELTPSLKRGIHARTLICEEIVEDSKFSGAFSPENFDKEIDKEVEVKEKIEKKKEVKEIKEKEVKEAKKEEVKEEVKEEKEKAKPKRKTKKTK